MKYRRMGRTGLKVSEMCLGTMIFGDQVEEARSNNVGLSRKHIMKAIADTRNG